MLPAVARPANLELQLAVLTTVYHWLQAFQDLRWRGKPDCQIGATHWQEWLQADAQRDAVQGVGPPPLRHEPSMRRPLGRALAPRTVPLANLPFDRAPKGAIRKSVPLPGARGATEPTKCPLCADKYYTSGVMLEHLAWHAVHATAPTEGKEAPPHMLQGRARRSPWHAPYAQRPPSPKRLATQRPRGRKRRHPTRPLEPAVQAIRGPSPHDWPLWPPRGPPWEQAPHTP